MMWFRPVSAYYIESGSGYRVSRLHDPTRVTFAAWGPGRDPMRPFIGMYDSGAAAREACEQHEQKASNKAASD